MDDLLHQKFLSFTLIEREVAPFVDLEWGNLKVGSPDSDSEAVDLEWGPFGGPLCSLLVFSQKSQVEVRHQLQTEHPHQLQSTETSSLPNSLSLCRRPADSSEQIPTEKQTNAEDADNHLKSGCPFACVDQEGPQLSHLRESSKAPASAEGSQTQKTDAPLFGEQGPVVDKSSGKEKAGVNQIDQQQYDILLNETAVPAPPLSVCQPAPPTTPHPDVTVPQKPSSVVSQTECPHGKLRRSACDTCIQEARSRQVCPDGLNRALCQTPESISASKQLEGRMKAEGWSGAGEDVDACLRETFESLRKVNEFLRPNQRPSPDFAAGLPNFQADIRNACFANAAFQLLAASDSYRSTAVQLLHSPFVADSPTRAVVLGILIVGLRDSRLRLQAASRIHQALPRFPNFRRHQDTRTGQVHCSHEFMITVLDLMDKNQTAPPRIETCDCYKCKSCGWVRESRKITGVPMVEIPIRTVESQQQQQQQGVSWTLENGIGEAMEQGKAGEWKGAREYDERCGNPDCPFFDGTEKVKNAFCQKIIYPPQTVLFHINRTVHSRDGLVMGKDTRHLEFGRTLDLGPFLCDRPSSGSSGAGSSVSSCTEDEKRERGGEVLYRLVGGVVHLGSRCASGHFRIFAFARRSCDVEVPYGQTEETRVVCLDAEAGREGRLNPFLVFDDAACPVARPWKELSKKEASLLLYEKAPAGYTRERETEGGVDREESKGEGKDAEGYEGGVGVTDAAEPANDPSASFALTDDALQMQHISVGEERDREAKREGETGEGGFSCSLLEGSGVEEGDLSGGQEKECEDNSPSTVSVAPRGAKVLLLHLFELEEQAEMGDVSDCSSATSSPMGSRAPSEAVSSPPLSPLASATLRELGWDLEAGVERYHQREESEETAYLFESLWKEKTRRLLLSAQRRDLVIFFLAFLSFFFGILGFLVLFRGPVLLPLSSSPSSFLVLSRRVGEEFFPAAVTAGCVWGGVGICFSFLFSAFTRADGKEKREVRRRKAGGDTGWQGRRAGLTGLPLLDCPDRPPESWKEAHQCWQEFEHRRWRSAFRTVLSFLSL